MSQYAYDSENRLTGFNSGAATYLYDGDGQLVAISSGGTTTSYLVDDQTSMGYTQLAEECANRAVAKSYIYGLQRISVRGADGVHWYAYDAHSGIRQLLDANGTVTDSYAYDAFGDIVVRSGATENYFACRGEQVDASSGLQYLRARWENQGSGRFLTRDPPPGDCEEPMSLSAYGYAANQLTTLVDPSGRAALCDSPPDPLEFGELGSFAALGNAVHDAVNEFFRQRAPQLYDEFFYDTSIQSIFGGKQRSFSRRWGLSASSRPDLVGISTEPTLHGEVYEIKPASQCVKGRQEARDYRRALQAADPQRGQ